jgi:hypothetical protein
MLLSFLVYREHYIEHYPFLLILSECFTCFKRLNSFYWNGNAWESIELIGYIWRRVRIRPGWMTFYSAADRSDYYISTIMWYHGLCGHQQYVHCPAIVKCTWTKLNNYLTCYTFIQVTFLVVKIFLVSRISAENKPWNIEDYRRWLCLLVENPSSWWSLEKKRFLAKLCPVWLYLNAFSVGVPCSSVWLDKALICAYFDRSI